MASIKCIDFYDTTGKLLNENTNRDLSDEDMEALNNFEPELYDWLYMIDYNNKCVAIIATDSNGFTLRQYNSFDDFEADALRFLEDYNSTRAFETRVGDSNDPYEIRIYWDETGDYADDRDYCQGLSDIKVRAFYPTRDALMQGWHELLEDYVGDTYSVWEHENCVEWGAYDPDDNMNLVENLFDFTSKPIPVCLYADSTGLYTSNECDWCNECYIDFPKYIVLDWYFTNFYKSNTPFDRWYNEEYTMDETDGLYQFAKTKYNYEGERGDGLSRKDVELAETIAETLDREDLPWWDKWNTHDIIEMLNDVDSCKKLIDSLLVMLINRGC